MKTIFAWILLLCCITTVHALANSPSYKLVVKKAERTLWLYRNDSLQKKYHIALGLTPIGSKERQGDYKTPEGEYYICGKNEHSQFYLSLAISYPNIQDAERGLKNNIITKPQYSQIKSAIEHRRKPPMNTKLGGDIFIHGCGSSKDWTWGCIALENADMKELFGIISAGTTVIIGP